MCERGETISYVRIYRREPCHSITVDAGIGGEERACDVETEIREEGERRALAIALEADRTEEKQTESEEGMRNKRKREVGKGKKEKTLVEESCTQPR